MAPILRGANCTTQIDLNLKMSPMIAANIWTEPQPTKTLSIETGYDEIAPFSTYLQPAAINH